MSEAEALDPRQTAILDNVEKFGLAVMHVAAEDTRAPYSFSIGFEHSLGQPEVLIYGLERDLAQSMINEVFRQCKEEGLQLADGQAIGVVKSLEGRVELVRAGGPVTARVGSDVLVLDRLRTGLFPDSPKPTVGADGFTYHADVPGLRCRLRVWDCACVASGAPANLQQQMCR